MEKGVKYKMNVVIKSFPALGGDSLYVSIDNGRYNMLIDTGFSSTYKSYIKDELDVLRGNNKHLDMLIITHIDNDHICGGIELLKNNTNNKIIQIDNIIYNGYKQIFYKNGISSCVNNSYKMKMNEIVSQQRNFVDHFENENLADVGFQEGHVFSELLSSGEYHVNCHFNGGPVYKDSNNCRNVISLSEDIGIIILSPTMDCLNMLIRSWESYLRSEGVEHIICEDSIKAFEAYNANQGNFEEMLEDVSIDAFNINALANGSVRIRKTVTNQSSIGFILCVKEKKYLFLGDAYADDITESLNDLYRNKIIENYDFELFKVAHHGSRNNVCDELLNLVNCKNFLICTNGANGHPDKETLAKIIKNNSNCNIYFNYKIPLIDELENVKEDQYRFNINVMDGQNGEVLELDF